MTSQKKNRQMKAQAEQQTNGSTNKRHMNAQYKTNDTLKDKTNKNSKMNTTDESTQKRQLEAPKKTDKRKQTHKQRNMNAQ